jgi:hypothetical protein
MAETVAAASVHLLADLDVTRIEAVLAAAAVPWSNAMGTSLRNYKKQSPALISNRWKSGILAHGFMGLDA